MATKLSRLHLAFDVGHSSIGWAVLLPTEPHPEILGTGTVLFPADDCLASQRRAFRRQRRHIRATRQRIARMKTWLREHEPISDYERALKLQLAVLMPELVPDVLCCRICWVRSSPR